MILCLLSPGMGGNSSKTVTETAVETSIKATLDVSVSRATNTVASQTGKFSGNTGTVVDGVTMKQKVEVKLKSSTALESATNFQDTLESKLNEQIKQKSEVGSVAQNDSETVTRLSKKFSADCSKVFSDHLSAFLAASQNLTIENNVNSQFSNIFMAQDAEMAISSIVSFITNDTVVLETKNELDKFLGQEATGMATMFQSMLGPLIVLAVMMALGIIIILLV